MATDAVGAVLVLSTREAAANHSKKLAALGYDVHCEETVEGAVRRAREVEVDAALVVCRGGPARETERALRERLPGMPVFVSEPDANAIEIAALLAGIQPRASRPPSSEPRSGPAIIGESSAIVELLGRLERIATSDATVLITGETGTGKELVARRIHGLSRRASGPFVALNCAAVPEGLVESELFGHVRGAFTDAKGSRRGLLVAASGGTIFLDEIGELPLAVQSKLLRALQERRIRPVGADVEIGFEARVIAATNRDLELEVAAGRFREDLFYRINVISLAIPPLRERGNDVLLLAQHFLRETGKRTQKSVTHIEESAARKLLSYPWPGNVRELENCIEQALAFVTSSRIELDDLPSRVRMYSASTAPSDPLGRRSTLEELERAYIAEVLDAVHGNKSEAARVLGIDRKTLYRRLETYRVSDAGSGSGLYSAVPPSGATRKRQG